MKQFIMALVLLISFLTNAVAKADDGLERGDLDTAIESAQLDKDSAQHALDSIYKDESPESTTVLANLE